MHIWQLCHLAMVVPIADAYYEADNPAKAGYEHKTMCKTAKVLKRNLQLVRKTCGKLSPWKMNIFLLVPLQYFFACAATDIDLYYIVCI